MKGGDTATTVFTYFYRLSDGDNLPEKKSSKDSFTGSGGLGIKDYFDLHKQIADLNALILTQGKDREIAELREQLKEGKGKGYFESIAEAMGKGWFEEHMQKEGFQKIEGGEWVKRTGSGSPSTTSAPATEKEKKAVETAKEKGMRGVKAMQRLVAVGGDEAINGLEAIAEMAEKNPVKLLEILKEVKE